MNSRLTSVFDENYQRYDDWFDNHPIIYKLEMSALQQFIPDSGFGLEVGVGTGRFAEPLGIRVGVEPSLNMARLAMERGVIVVRGIGEKLPFKNHSFDYIVFITTICFVDDISGILKEAWRVLKDESVIIIGFVPLESPLGKMYKEKKDDSLFYSSATFYRTSQVINCLKEAGFENISSQQTLFTDNIDDDKLYPIREGYGDGSFVVLRATRR